MIAVPAPVPQQQLILTIYGLYGRRGGGQLPISVLIQMPGDLGHDAPGIGSAASQLKAKGVLTSVKNGRGQIRALGAFAEADQSGR